MSNVESINNREVIKNPDLIETKSTQIERLEGIIPEAGVEEVKEYCNNLNNIFTEEFSKKGLSFLDALKSKVKNPIV